MNKQYLVVQDIMVRMAKVAMAKSCSEEEIDEFFKIMKKIHGDEWDEIIDVMNGSVIESKEIIEQAPTSEANPDTVD